MRGAVDKMLLHLVKLRASQINGCAFCVNLTVAIGMITLWNRWSVAVG